MSTIDYRWDYLNGHQGATAQRYHVRLPDPRTLPAELAEPVKAFTDARDDFEKARKAFRKAQDEPKRLLAVARDDARTTGHKGGKVDGKKMQRAIRAAEDALAEREFEWVAAEARLSAAHEALIDAVIVVAPGWRAESFEQIRTDVSRLNTARQMANDAAAAVADRALILGMLHELEATRELVLRPIMRRPGSKFPAAQPQIEAAVAADHLVAAIQAAHGLVKIATAGAKASDEEEVDEAEADGWEDDDDDD